jgi:tetratricopeptide (TPR) repeat protein
LGFCLICAGDYERGYKLLSESIQVNPYYQWWFNAGLSIYHFHNSEFEEAIYWANKIQKQSVIWELILKITSYSELNNYSDASFCLEELRKEIPSISENIKPILGSFLQSEILVDRFWNAFKKVDI